MLIHHKKIYWKFISNVESLNKPKKSQTLSKIERFLPDSSLLKNSIKSTAIRANKIKPYV